MAMRLGAVLVAEMLVDFLALPIRAASAADAIFAQATTAPVLGQYEVVRTLKTSGLAEAELTVLIKSRLLVLRGLAQQAQGAANEALIDFTTALSDNALTVEERARALSARGLSLESL